MVNPMVLVLTLIYAGSPTLNNFGIKKPPCLGGFQFYNQTKYFENQ